METVEVEVSPVKENAKVAGEKKNSFAGANMFVVTRSVGAFVPVLRSQQF